MSAAFSSSSSITRPFYLLSLPPLSLLLRGIFTISGKLLEADDPPGGGLEGFSDPSPPWAHTLNFLDQRRKTDPPNCQSLLLFCLRLFFFFHTITPLPTKPSIPSFPSPFIHLFLFDLSICSCTHSSAQPSSLAHLFPHSPGHHEQSITNTTVVPARCRLI